MTVHQLLTSMTAYELAEWQAFFTLMREEDKPSSEAVGEQVKLALEGLKR